MMDRRCFESSRYTVLTAGLVVLSAVLPCLAQSNSLFRSARRAAAVPTSQPASAGPREVLLPQHALRLAPPSAVGEPRPVPNAMLLRSSLIAVEAPEPRRIAVNDIITVIVRLDRRAESDGSLESEKSWEFLSELRSWIKLDDDHNLETQTFPNGVPRIDFEFENRYEGEGNSERTDTLTTRLPCKVMDVKPNGNLIIQGQEEVKVGEETIAATITGECSSDDVSPQRTVLSSQVYNLRIDMPDRGAVRDATRRGWLMRAFDLLRPL